MSNMRRREFISLLGSAAAAWPIAAQAQQPAMPVIGLLSGRSLDDSKSMMLAFRRGLMEEGFVERQNVAIEYRWAEGHYDRLPALAADLVGGQVAVILAVGSVPSPLAAKAATSTIPIVFVVGGDPVKFGLVSSLHRPGGNLTGVSVLSGALTAKRLELLRELVPHAGIVACLVNPKNPEADNQLIDIRTAARTVRQEILVLNASIDHELDTAITTLVRERASGLLVGNDAFFVLRREQLIALTARHRIPTIYFLREFAEAGGLMSYGDSLNDAYRQVGVYIGRILKGMKPADLPVVQSTKVELTINFKTAKALGLEVPPTLLARADEVIE
jgi:putative ABC transport system substrate-binding protein